MTCRRLYCIVSLTVLPSYFQHTVQIEKIKPSSPTLHHTAHKYSTRKNSKHSHGNKKHQKVQSYIEGLLHFAIFLHSADTSDWYLQKKSTAKFTLRSLGRKPRSIRRTVPMFTKLVSHTQHEIKYATAQKTTSCKHTYVSDQSGATPGETETRMEVCPLREKASKGFLSK